MAKRISGGFEDRLTTAPETSDAADITFLPKKRASEGPGPPQKLEQFRPSCKMIATQETRLVELIPQ